ncbi:GH14204 [Drosophila grimshawi]|uniref:GH14204 n=1 Tax=Drosophila grimshawi TaxID=7222 RepID=B4JY04_DROGR|nr:GH14204 [Drosophila grimshawi]
MYAQKLLSLIIKGDLSHLSPDVQLAPVLRFLATGAHQSNVARDKYVNIGSSTFGKVLRDVIPIMQDKLCTDSISLEISKEQLKQSRDYFMW